MPTAAALVGLVFHHQVAQVELDLAANIAQVTTSNALALTVGWF